jgi:hypothetical protein
VVLKDLHGGAQQAVAIDRLDEELRARLGPGEDDSA